MSGPSRSRIARAATPLVALLPLVALVSPIPALGVLRVFAGPLAVLGLGGLLLGLVAEHPRGREAAGRLRAALGRGLRGARGPAAVFAVALVGVSLVRGGLISSDPHDARREHLLTGDEPTYLLITHSLVFDHDLNVFNNREQGHARHFYGRPLLGPGQFGFAFYNRVSGGRLTGREGEWVGRERFVHMPGLPILIAPAYWAGFHGGGRIRFAVLSWLNLLAAALAALTFTLARRVADPGVAALATLGVALTPPLVYYASQIYPELPAGLVLTGALSLLARRPGPAAMGAAGCLVAALPWLNERFLGVAVVLAAAALVLRSGAWHRIAIVVPLLISLGLLGAYYWQLYGVPLPVNSRKPLVLCAIPTGSLAILTDRDRGVLFLNPVLLLGALGLAALRSRDGWLAGTLTIAVAVYLLPLAAFPDWYGGFCPPLRYVAPVAALLVLPLAALLSDVRWPLTRAGAWALGAWAGWLGFRLAASPSLWFWEYGSLFAPRSLQSAHALFPGYYHPAPGSVTRSLLWLGLVALLPVLDWRLARRGVPVTGGTAWRALPVIFAGGILVISIVSHALA
jgi:hypothetical protein